MVYEVPQGYSDVPKITPEGVVADMISQGITEVLGDKTDTLHVGNKKVQKYTTNDWNIYIWPDPRRQENIIFVSPVYVGENNEISWYIGRTLIVKIMIKNLDQREFIARCARREVTPENLEIQHEVSI
ncbi:MAG: hypothetical protein WC753_02610 [Candidatus Gracilibacteria bacterium]